MNRIIHYVTAGIIGAVMAGGAGAQAPPVLVTEFNDFFSNELYASWTAPETVIVSGPDSYSITATGYGSNYVFIGGLGIVGEGTTHVELDVTLSGPPAAEGRLGPIISFVDGDGSYYNYAWFGQMLGDHLLRVALATPSFITAPGTTPGLDLNQLLHMHMQLDPSTFGTNGAYTVEFKNLNLLTAKTGDFDADNDVDSLDFLTWQRDPRVAPLSDWIAHFGETSAVVAAWAVPEPATGWMLIVSLGMLRLTRTPSASGRRVARRLRS
jgi:hypothetical protein